MELPKNWKTKSSEVIWKFYSIALTKSNISNNAIQLYVQKYMSRRSNSSGIENSSAPAPHLTVHYVFLGDAGFKKKYLLEAAIMQILIDIILLHFLSFIFSLLYTNEPSHVNRFLKSSYC